VRAVYSEGVSNPSNSSTVNIEIPYAPRNLTATLSGINSAQLSWEAPPLLRDRALMGYMVYRDNVLVGQVETPDLLQYLDAGLPEGVYYYEVSAVWNAGESPRSNVAQLAIGVPMPPSNVQAMVTGSDVHLSWYQEPAPFISGFKVFRNGVMVALLDDPLQTTYVDAGRPNGHYSYYLRTVFVEGESGNSATVHVNVEVPYPPVDLNAVVQGDDVHLTWSNPEQVRALTHYYIYRNNQIIAAIYNPFTTAYLDQNLANGLYTYKITAVYSGVESAPSAPVNALVEVLYPPRNLSATVNLADVNLAWMSPLNQGGLLRALTGFNIYRDGVLLGFVSGSGTVQYTDMNRPNGVYDYAVSAVYSTGESSQAVVQNVLVEVLYPVAELLYQVLDDDVYLSWSAAPGAPGRNQAIDRNNVSYKLYKDGLLIHETAELSYVDYNLVNGVYQYYVTAVYDTGDSEPSPVIDVFVEVPYPPTALVAEVDADNVTLSWTAPVESGGLSRALQGYQIHRDGLMIDLADDTQYLDAGLANGDYTYQIFAVYEQSISAPSNSVIATVEVH
ncbi:MAG: fibronectin type III domain-containing protein, partial [Candidatus Cloacimonadaceae bacterium]|nr:fibronectin type III domain-containing protein [Candidatus Cloacimonadaceae bacterium]